MSDRATTWAWLQEPSSDKAWLALILLANNADNHGVIEGSLRKQWAALLRCSVDTFDRRVKSLVDDGLLKVDRQKGKRGFGASIYRLQIDEGFAARPSRISAATQKTAASRENHDAPRETIQASSEAAELRLAATAAASKKNSNTEIDIVRTEIVVASQPRKRGLPETHIAPDAEITDELRAVAAEFGFLNGTGEAIFRDFRDWHDENGVPRKSWKRAFRKWCEREDPNRRKTHDEYEHTDDGRSRGRSARQDRSGMVGGAEPLGRPRRSRSRAEAALRLIDELEARDGNHGPEAGRAEADSAPLIAYVVQA